MKEFIALLAVANACFILGSFFGALVYHAILKVFKKGESEVKEYSDRGAALFESVSAAIEGRAKKVEQDVKDGLPHV